MRFGEFLIMFERDNIKDKIIKIKIKILLYREFYINLIMVQSYCRGRQLFSIGNSIIFSNISLLEH
jgi:hypothetical protein